MTDRDKRQQQISAQMAYEDATAELASLILKLKEIGKRAAHIASVLTSVPLEPVNPLNAESNLYKLSHAEFEGIDYETIRETTNAIVLARKSVTETKALARAMGCSV